MGDVVNFRKARKARKDAKRRHEEQRAVTNRLLHGRSKAERKLDTARDAKVRRGETQFAVSLYNVTAMAVRETATMQIAASDVPAAYRTLREAIGKLKASRVIKAELNEQDRNRGSRPSTVKPTQPVTVAAPSAAAKAAPAPSG